MKSLLTRRAALALAAFPVLVGAAQSETPAKIAVAKDPNCGCCGGWVEHLRANGFVAEVTDTTDLRAVKARLGIPAALQSCHTAEVGAYAIEGHVPASAIKRLLAERPSARGLAVPGMPIGSPGMEVEGSPAEPYEVVLFGPQGQRTYARYRGPDEIKS